MNEIKTTKLFILIIAQFFCTSLWFAPNSVIENLILSFRLSQNSLSNLTIAVQFGFILGTLIFALTCVADRFSPSKVFFISATIGALANLAILYEHNNYYSLISLRFLTGFALAGIYPVGMKIAADYFKEGLGTSLGFLVGALVLGTAFPHFIKATSQELLWEAVITTTSALSFLGGFMVLVFIPNGPHRKQNKKPNFKIIFSLFKNKEFKISALGYFGHMWELYALWTFVPVIISRYFNNNPNEKLDISLLTFFVIAIGSFACVMGGYLSQKFKTKTIARTFLVLSGICCLVFPLFYQSSGVVFSVFLLFWGFVVIGDSPLFSTLIAKNTNPETKGTALTIVNSIGFAITIISIQLINFLGNNFNSIYLYMLLAIGPILGSIGLFKKKATRMN